MVERPAGRSISVTQATQSCQLKNRWKRERAPEAGLGTSLLYGRALHQGIELRLKGAARNTAEAVKAAIAYFDRELVSPRREASPILWDEPIEATQDGRVSLARYNYGRLSHPELVRFWLRQQIPDFLSEYGSLKVVRSEHQLFIPLTTNRHWSQPWSFEAWLDFETEGHLIIDLKSTGEPWDETEGSDDQRKYMLQAQVYMAAYERFYGAEPNFKFVVLPRASLPLNRGGPAPAGMVQEIDVRYRPELAQRFLDGVIKPNVEAQDRGIYPANPGGWWCSRKWCSYWDHCGLGGGEHL